MNNSIDKNNSGKINQVLMYVLIILVTFIVTISFFKLIEFGTSSSEFVAKFEFGATISSIILSFVAIVYTLIQSKQSDSVNAKVMDAADEIEKNGLILGDSVEEIKSEINILKEMDIDGILKSNMLSFAEKLIKLEELLNGGFKGIRESIESFNPINIKNMDVQNVDSSDVKYLEFIIKRFSSNSSYGYPLHLCIYIILHFYANYDINKSKTGEPIDGLNDFYRYARKLSDEIDSLEPFSHKVNLYEHITELYLLFLTLGFTSNGVTAAIDKKIIIESLQKLRSNAKEFASVLEPCYEKVDSLSVN